MNYIFFLYVFFCIITQTTSFLPKISGFYGLVGPNIDKKKVNTLYELFIGDGVIQGVFFDKGKITFIKHVINTEKIQYEKKHGKFSKNNIMMFFYMMLHEMKIMPNPLGLANTALLDIHDAGVEVGGLGTGVLRPRNILSLFERDQPYKIQVDFKNKQLNTICKINTQQIKHFSGHSKYDVRTNTLHTIDYNVLCNDISYFQTDNTFHNIIEKAKLKTEYVPIIHDFFVLHDAILYIDSPIVWNFLKETPVFLYNKKPTYIKIYNMTTQKTTQYTCKENGFYIFHYGDVIDTPETIEIYGPLYESLDFTSLNIDGKYRKILVNKKTGQVSIHKNPLLENMNLDFPVKWNEYVLLRNLYGNERAIKGLVVCKGIEIVKQMNLPENRFLCGEPAIVEHEGIPIVVGFVYDREDNGYFIMFDMFNLQDSYVEVPVPIKNMTIGFHSVVLSDSDFGKIL
jgi:carotenoid cleavage dioxygenase-like enzyme